MPTPRTHRPCLIVPSHALLLTLLHSALSADPGNHDLHRVRVRLEDANEYVTNSTHYYRPSFTLTEFATIYSLVYAAMPPLESDDFDAYYRLFSSLRRVRANHKL